MKNTEIYTDVTVNGRSFTLKKFDARTGLKLARLVLAKAAPILPSLVGDIPSAGQKKTGSKAAKNANNERFIYDALAKVLDCLTDEEIDMLIDKCLRNVYEKLPAGLQPVIDENGFYGVEGVEYDMPLTLKLCFEAIKWGAGDFFGEEGLDLSLLTK